MKTNTSLSSHFPGLLITACVIVTFGILLPDCMELFTNLVNGLQDRLYDFGNQAEQFYAGR